MYDQSNAETQCNETRRSIDLCITSSISVTFDTELKRSIRVFAIMIRWSEMIESRIEAVIRRRTTNVEHDEDNNANDEHNVDNVHVLLFDVRPMNQNGQPQYVMSR